MAVNGLSLLTRRTGDFRSPRGQARLILLIGILAGILNLLAIPFVAADQLMLASDVYQVAADAALQGENFYTAEPADRPGYHYLYPPITIVLFIPHALAGSDLGAFALQTALNVGFGAGLAVMVWRALQRRGIELTATDRALIFGFVLLSAHSMITLVNGQINIPLAFALAVGFDAIERERNSTAGLAFAIAASLKVFPALVGLWLVRRSAWRGVAGALATGIGGLALGVALLGPSMTEAYLTEVLLARYETETFEGRPAPTATADGVQRQLAALTGLGSPWISIGGVAILGCLLAIVYRAVDTDERHIAAMLATVVCAMLVLPLRPLYYPFLAYPLLLALYRFSDPTARWLLVGGTLVTFLRFEYTMVVNTITAAGMPGVVESPVISGITALYSAILPPTIGLWLILMACLLVQRSGRYLSDEAEVPCCR